MENDGKEDHLIPNYQRAPVKFVRGQGSTLVDSDDNKIDKESWIKNYMNILITMSPVIPHFASECLQNLDTKNLENQI